MFFPTTKHKDSNLSFADNVLVIPAVSIANVGQLAVDLLLNQTLENDVERVGYLHSRHVLPMVGNHPLDATPTDQMTCNIEVFQCQAKKITIVQQRAPTRAGHVAGYVADLVQWIQAANFRYVLTIGGADASSRVDSQIVNRQPRFVTSSKVEVPFIEQMGAMNLLQLEERRMNFRTGEPLPPGPNVLNGGLLNQFYKVCEEQGIAFVGLVLFCKEGMNIPEGVTMGTCANDLIGLVAKSSETGKIEWRIPSSWETMIRGTPDPLLYF